jgi:hypothetical protein
MKADIVGAGLGLDVDALARMSHVSIEVAASLQIRRELTS